MLGTHIKTKEYLEVENGESLGHKTVLYSVLNIKDAELPNPFIPAIRKAQVNLPKTASLPVVQRT